MAASTSGYWALMGAPHQLEAVRANLEKRAPVFAEADLGRAP